MSYEVKFHVKDKIALSTLMSSVDSITDIELISALPIAKDKPRKKIMRYANGKRNKGISGRSLVLQVLAKGQKSEAQIAKAFKGRGFAPTSYTVAISALKAEKKIESLSGNLFKLK